MKRYANHSVNKENEYSSDDCDDDVNYGQPNINNKRQVCRVPKRCSSFTPFAPKYVKSSKIINRTEAVYIKEKSVYLTMRNDQSYQWIHTTFSDLVPMLRHSFDTPPGTSDIQTFHPSNNHGTTPPIADNIRLSGKRESPASFMERIILQTLSQPHESTINSWDSARKYILSSIVAAFGVFSIHVDGIGYLIVQPFYIGTHLDFVCCKTHQIPFHAAVVTPAVSLRHISKSFEIKVFIALTAEYRVDHPQHPVLTSLLDGVVDLDTSMHPDQVVRMFIEKLAVGTPRVLAQDSLHEGKNALMNDWTPNKIVSILESAGQGFPITVNKLYHFPFFQTSSYQYVIDLITCNNVLYVPERVSFSSRSNVDTTNLIETDFSDTQDQFGFSLHHKADTDNYDSRYFDDLNDFDVGHQSGSFLDFH